jgi:purine-binding chemotaxis protein CheW
MPTEYLCTFDVDTLFIGIPISCIQEILRPQSVTPVPLAAPAVLGLMSLRGQIVPVISLAERLGVQLQHGGAEAFNVLIRTPDGPVSLLVDRVGDVVEVPHDAFEPAPDTMRSAMRSLILGAYKLEKRLLLALDAEAAVHVES